MAAMVRPRAAGDSRAVRRVARSAWRATYSRLAPAAFIRAVLRGGYGRERLLRGLTDPRRDALVVEEGGLVLGYADVLEEPPRACELMRIYVDPPAQGRGLGRALLLEAARAARRRGASSLSVAVDRRNRRAQAWYRRQGFRPAGRATFDLAGWSRPQVALALDLAAIAPPATAPLSPR